MNNILNKICKDKIIEIKEAKNKLSLDELKKNIKKKKFAFSKQIDNFKFDNEVPEVKIYEVENNSGSFSTGDLIYPSNNENNTNSSR